MKAPRPNRAGREVAASPGFGKKSKEGKRRSRRGRKQEARRVRRKEQKVFPSRYSNGMLHTPHQTDNEGKSLPPRRIGISDVLAATRSATTVATAAPGKEKTSSSKVDTKRLATTAAATTVAGKHHPGSPRA